MEPEVVNEVSCLAEASEWFDWLRKELPMGGVSLPDEETAVHLIYHSLRLTDRVQEIAYLPESLREKLLQAAIVYQCWKLQRDYMQRAAVPSRRTILPAVKAMAYLGKLGRTGTHHLVEAEDGFRYVVTIPSGLWVEALPATEIICNEAARLLGLTVPSSSIVTLGPEMLRIADLQRATWDRAKPRCAAKPCCGFRYVEAWEEVDLAAAANQDRTTKQQFLGRLVFNVWVGNLRPEKLSIYRDQSTGRARPIFYDHSRCFFGGPDVYPSKAYLADYCPRVQLSVADRKGVLRWVRQTESLNMNPLWDLLVEMPLAWYGGRRGRMGEALQQMESNKSVLKSAMKRLLNIDSSAWANDHRCKRDTGCSSGLACKIATASPNRTQR